jgi:hypothetical protein
MTTTGTDIKSTSFVVTPEASEIAGAISYWRLSGSVSLAGLTAAWAAEGLDPELLPDTPANDVALGRAVRDLQAKRRLVRPLARRGAWVVKDETVTADGKDVIHVRVASVKFADGGPVIDPGEASIEAFESVVGLIREGFRRACVELAPEDISYWLIGLANANASVSLRESGGIYFLPRTSTDFWRRVVRAVESCSGHRIFQIPAMKNSEAISAIFDAVVNEANRAVAAIETELLAEGDDRLGARALESRAAACDAMLTKIASYETLLGVPFDVMRSRVDDLRANVAAAALRSDDDAAVAA